MPAPPPLATNTDPLPQLRAGVGEPCRIRAAAAAAAGVRLVVCRRDSRRAHAARDVDAAPRARERCVSIGPFNDLAQAARGAALLRDRGFDPKQRAEQGEMWEGYWVSVGDLRTTADETKLMKALERAGIRDARVMPGRAGWTTYLRRPLQRDASARTSAPRP